MRRWAKLACFAAAGSSVLVLVASIPAAADVAGTFANSSDAHGYRVNISVDCWSIAPGLFTSDSVTVFGQNNTSYYVEATYESANNANDFYKNVDGTYLLYRYSTSSEEREVVVAHPAHNLDYLLRVAKTSDSNYEMKYVNNDTGWTDYEELSDTQLVGKAEYPHVDWPSEPINKAYGLTDYNDIQYADSQGNWPTAPYTQTEEDDPPYFVWTSGHSSFRAGEACPS